MTASDLRAALKCTKVCRHWKVGTCSKGTGCNFAHSDLELREQPNWTKTELCFRFMSKGRCGKGASCSFAHGRGELRGSTAAALPRAPERRKGLTEPMKVDIHRVSDQTTAWDTWTQLPFRPPPGLEPPPFIFSLVTDVIGNDFDSLSIASTSFPCTPRVEGDKP
ncbi:Zinc finger protein zfs1 (Multicopy suppressor of overexpressed cyr1 protein 4) [Durusdinium trenchii]|uniref:Zinc finger protein zfs1 (Multicopy suppressor of overexpressed cyr1 protein 4) n=1 Tax=Durusdinium trenchii TaxID=1381693 RepID=A0ABP0RH56_9DINO